MIGQALPDVSLAATDGTLVNLSKLSGFSVAFFYPYTGRPGVADPPNWDNIPDAHGSTPQAIGFSKAYTEFQNLSVRVFGVSLQRIDWQKEFVERNAITFQLLSDFDAELSSALRLETFVAGDQHYLSRITLIICDGVIVHVRKPVRPPAADASECLKYFAK